MQTQMNTELEMNSLPPEPKTNYSCVLPVADLEPEEVTKVDIGLQELARKIENEDTQEIEITSLVQAGDRADRQFWAEGMVNTLGKAAAIAQLWENLACCVAKKDSAKAKFFMAVMELVEGAV